MSGPLARGDKSTGFVKATAPFVGRAQEIALFDRWLREAAAGEPRVVLIEGDAGIGKSRLVHEVQSIAAGLGMDVCFGRCYEDLALPYLPFIESLLPQLERLPDGMRRSVGSDFDFISNVLRRADSTSSSSRYSLTVPADHERLQLLLAMGHVIVKLAQQRPMVFVVDDLHWADRLSLDLFEHLAFTVTDLAGRDKVPLLIIGSHRPVATTERLARLSARLRREEITRTFTLHGLSEAEISELLGGLGLRRPAHQLTATMSEATQGNPLFIQEVLHHLLREDALREQGGYLVTTTAPADLRLPEEVTVAIITRARAVSDACRHVLTFAAFLGDTIHLKQLSVVSGTDENGVLLLLEEAMRQDLLRSEADTFHFAHPLIRHVFYHEPSTPRRQRLHREIARNLQALYVNDVDAHLLEIAHHLVRAGTAADAQMVAEHARRAADQAFGVFAWTEAARYYEAALTAAESTGQLPIQERADLHYWAGLAHYYDQDVGPCLHHYDKAIDGYRTAGNLPGLAKALMEKTRTHFTLATVPLGTVTDIQPLEDVLAALGNSEPGLRGHIAAVVAEAYRNGRQAVKATQWGQQAVDIGRELQDDRLCAYAGFALGLAHINDLHVHDALDSWQTALIHARRADDFIREAWALHRIPLALTLLGRLAEADAVAVRACESTRRSHDWSNHSLGLSHQASVAATRGDFALVERCAHEAMSMVSRSHYPWGAFRALLALASARALRGAWGEAYDVLDILVEPGRVFQDAGPVILAFARIFRELLRAYADEKNGAVQPLAADVMDIIGRDTYSLAPLCALVELTEIGAARVSIDLLYERLSNASAQGIVFSSGWMFLIPRALGVAASVRRRWETAEAHFREAVEVAAKTSARPELARTHLDYARMLIRRGGESNRRTALELVKAAGPIFSELGMQPFAERASAVSQAAGIDMPVLAPRRQVYPNDLSEREVDVLVRMARGRSRLEIAGDLMLGRTTIAQHIQSIFDKINVEDEAAARAYAVESGLTAAKPEEGNASRSLRIILVTDIVASSALIQRAGDARAHDLMQHHNRLIRQCLAGHDGVEVIHTGDGIEASFVTAASAVECAIAIQKAFAAHNRTHPSEPIDVRLGMNAGEPIATEGRLFGAAVHAAFGICARARPGQILVSDVVAQLTAGQAFNLTARGRIGLKGLGRIRVYEVSWQEAGA
jgi:eukaryotic-like serine/threonine-protein kinase